MKQIPSAYRQPFYWDSLLVTIETRSQLISNRELRVLAKSKCIPLPGAPSENPADSSRADEVFFRGRSGVAKVESNLPHHLQFV